MYEADMEHNADFLIAKSALEQLVGSNITGAAKVSAVTQTVIAKSLIALVVELARTNDMLETINDKLPIVP